MTGNYFTEPDLTYRKNTNPFHKYGETLAARGESVSVSGSVFC